MVVVALNPNILRLAVFSSCKDLEAGAERDIRATGVPGVQSLRVAGRVGGLSVVAVDDKLIDPIVLPAIHWEPVTARNESHLEREPAWVGGCEGIQLVDTAVFCWKMACSCGRIRYAKANSRHQVKRCRICTKQRQLQRRAERQRELRGRAIV